MPGEGRKVDRVLGVDPALDRVAVEAHFLLRHRQIAAGGDADLFQHQVDIGDRLGHRVLDLDAGVHLDEVEAAILEQELDGAGAQIFQFAHRFCDASRRSLRVLRR